jgi:hypothetical protein
MPLQTNQGSTTIQNALALWTCQNVVTNCKPANWAWQASLQLPWRPLQTNQELLSPSRIVTVHAICIPGPCKDAAPASKHVYTQRLHTHTPCTHASNCCCACKQCLAPTVNDAGVADDMDKVDVQSQELQHLSSSSSCYQSSHSINAIDPAPHWSIYQAGYATVRLQLLATSRQHLAAALSYRMPCA